MYFKRNLKNIFFRFALHLKSLGLIALVPLIITNLISPLLAYLVYGRYGISINLQISIREFSQLLFPLASVWWPMFVMREYIEGDGKELFYINKTNSILFDLFFLFIVELLNIILVFSIYVWLVPQLNYDYIRIVIICLLYFSVILFVGFITNSSATTIFFVILYYIVNVFLGRGQNSAFLIYFSSEPLTKKSFLSNYLPLLIISVFLMIFGIVLNRKKIKFK